MFDVTHYAHNPCFAPMWNRYSLADRIAIWKAGASEEAVNYNHFLGLDVIRAVNITPAQQRYSHRREVIRASPIIDCTRDLRHGRRLMRSNPERTGIARLAQWAQRRNIRRLHTRNLADSFDQLLVSNART